MTCPDSIARILLAIIRTAALRVRTLGWSGDARRCAVEADHIHNLPDLLIDYSAEGLRYYWEVEKPSYERASSPSELAAFRSLWDELEQVLECSRAAEAP
jgi:hypothetical protein